MKTKLLVVFTILFLSMSTAAQTPNPCSKENQRATTAEILAQSEQIRADQNKARVNELAQQLAAERGKSNSTEQRLSAEQQNSASLMSQNINAQQKILDLEKLLAVRTSERDSALLKIRKANGRWICEIFHVWCIKE